MAVSSLLKSSHHKLIIRKRAVIWSFTIASTQMGRTFTRNTANTKQNDIVTPVGTLFREVFSQIGYGRKRQ